MFSTIFGPINSVFLVIFRHDDEKESGSEQVLWIQVYVLVTYIASPFKHTVCFTHLFNIAAS